MKESTIQQQICDYLSAAGYFYFSVPNEHYNISHAQRTTLKKMGLTPGIPDLVVCSPGRRVIFIEVKNETGVVSKDQKIVHAALRRIGHVVYVVRSVEDVISIMENL
jgi:hypothetical protein